MGCHSSKLAQVAEGEVLPENAAGFKLATKPEAAINNVTASAAPIAEPSSQEVAAHSSDVQATKQNVASSNSTRPKFILKTNAPISKHPSAPTSPARNAMTNTTTSSIIDMLQQLQHLETGAKSEGSAWTSIAQASGSTPLMRWTLRTGKSVRIADLKFLALNSPPSSVSYASNDGKTLVQNFNIQVVLDPLCKEVVDKSEQTLLSILYPEKNGSTSANSGSTVIQDQKPPSLTRNLSHLRQSNLPMRYVYGVTTGFGGSVKQRVDDVHQIQYELLRLLHTTFGELLPASVVRCAMAVRLRSNIEGASAVRWTTLEQYANLLNSGIVPAVPVRGSISASGDLSPNSHICSVMVQLEESRVLKPLVTTDNTHLDQLALAECGTPYVGTSASSVMPLAKLQPVKLAAKEGLALLNGTNVCAAYAALVSFDAGAVLLWCQACTALLVPALEGHVESFHPFIQQVHPHDGQIEVAANIYRLLDQTETKWVRRPVSQRDADPWDELSPVQKVLHAHEHTGRAVEAEESFGLYMKQSQDRYALRTVPQWLGPVADAFALVVRQVETELNSASDNPLVDSETGIIFHGGNFQGQAVTAAMDSMRVHCCSMAKLLLAQFQQLMHPMSSEGLPENLAAAGSLGVDMGFKGCDINMAALCTEICSLAMPLAAVVHSAEMHNQNINSMALVSARQTQTCITILYQMIALHLLALAQAIDLRALLHRFQTLVCERLTQLLKTGELFQDQQQQYKSDYASCIPLITAALRETDPLSYVYEFGRSYPTLQQLFLHYLQDRMPPIPLPRLQIPVLQSTVKACYDEAASTILAPYTHIQSLGAPLAALYRFVRVTCDVPICRHAPEGRGPSVSLRKIQSMINGTQGRQILASLFSQQ